MPKEEWGVKRVCPTTGRRFYDLNRDPVISPYTGEVVTFDDNTHGRVAIAEKPHEPVKEAVVAKDDDDLLDADDLLVEDDAVDAEVDDDLLEDDDDSVSLDEIADVAADDDDE